MTDRLRRALAEAGAVVPPFDLYEQALADGRRLRRRRTIRAAVGAAVVVLLAVALPGVLAGAGSGSDGSPAVFGSGGPSLPDRISTTWPWTATVGLTPAGPAALVVNQQLLIPSSLAFPEATVAAVGATGNTYRTMDFGGRMRLGADGLLSPDGTRFVEPSTVHDLVTGAMRPVPGTSDSTRTVPLAWAPDGDTLAVIREVRGSGPGGNPVQAATVGLLDLTTAHYRSLLDVTAQRGGYLGTPGHIAAFSPDGTRLAVQFGDKITVYTLNTGTRHSFVLPHDSQLAGKGAFTPDGRWLAVVTRAACCPEPPSRDRFPSRWRIRLLDPATGAERPEWSLPEVSGVTALRLIGWWPSGEAVVAGYYPALGRSAEWNPEAADPNNDLWAFPNYYESVSHVEVRALATGSGSGSRELLSLPDNVYGIDIATDVLAAGVVRPGDDAPIRPIRPGWLGATFGLGVLLGSWIIAISLVVLHWRRRQPRPGR